MKGTLFSADFVKDSSDNLRLLEFNTDTAFTSGALHNTDFTEFFNLISSSNIDEVNVIYKSVVHDNFVSELSQSLAVNGFTGSYVTHPEAYSTIYPTSVADSDSKFILRLAYDESAIFDSTYCKQDDELLKLYYDNNDTGSIPNMFQNTSEHQVDTLLRSENASNIPDIVVKDVENPKHSLKFYKLQSSGTITEKVDAFVSSSAASGSIVMNYYNDTDASVASSIRSFNIIYGTDLSLMNLATVEVDAILQKATTLTTSGSSNLVDTKHYYEFATNFPIFNGYGGIFEEEEIVNEDGTAVKVKDTVVGNRYKSTYIEGAPDSDSVDVFTSWSSPGSSFPSGSYTTSSALVNSISDDLPRKLIYELETDTGASFRAQANQHLLIYDTAGDKLRYKDIYDLDISNDKLLDTTGSLVNISSKDIQVLEGDHKTYILDLESTDTFILKDGDINLKIITHNCFPAGTKILLEDGTYKNIEDITTSDILLTYNNDKKEYGAGKVGTIRVTTQNKLIKLTTDNGEEIKSTPRHKIYTNGGWKAAEELVIGDSLFNKNGELVKLSEREVLDGEFEVFHLIDVKDDHTYFAEDLLVHNVKSLPSPTCFAAGTKITLSDGSEKNIEDIVVGDVVKGWDSTNDDLADGEVIGVDSSHTVASHAEACKSLGDEPSLYTINDTGIEFTPEHPFLTADETVEGGPFVWKSLVPDSNQEPYKSEQEPLELKVGDSISHDGEWIEIESIKVVRSDASEKVYNITVKDLSSYIANGIIVHNK